MSSSILLIVALGVIGAGLTFEYFRFQDALHVATEEHRSYVMALNDTACAKDSRVRSIEWRGQVLDCNLARLILQRTPRASAYILWWNQSAWVSLWQRITHNIVVMTIICTVLVGVTVNAIVNAFTTLHLTRTIERQYSAHRRLSIKPRQERVLALPPPPQPQRQVPTWKRKVYEDASEVD